MDKNLQESIDTFIHERVNHYELTAPDSQTEATSVIAHLIETLGATLNSEQLKLLNTLDNAIGMQSGEDRFYFYKAGFSDALKLLK